MITSGSTRNYNYTCLKLYNVSIIVININNAIINNYRGHCQERVSSLLAIFPFKSSAMSALWIMGDSRAVNKSFSCGPFCNHSTSICVKHLVTLSGLLAFSSAIACIVQKYINLNPILNYYCRNDHELTANCNLNRQTN